jgi:guanylate kinase|nr:MAG TPA_asm: Guanylate kinase [Caudoviricetes sp.]
MHTAFLIVGKSGSGKDSLVSKLCEKYGYSQLKSYATRPRREGEGDTHTFINSDEVEQYRDQMIAYTRIGEFEYFATKQQLYESDFYCIDYRGIEYMHNLELDLSDIRFVTIYIHVSDNIREERAINGRKDNALTFYKRCFSENEQFIEMIMRDDFDYAISNIDFNKAVQVLESIIKIETVQN